MTEEKLENFKRFEILAPTIFTPAPKGSCKFVGQIVFEGSIGRVCLADKSICFNFANSELYTICPTYKKAVREACSV